MAIARKLVVRIDGRIAGERGDWIWIRKRIRRDLDDFLFDNCILSKCGNCNQQQDAGDKKELFRLVHDQYVLFYKVVIENVDLGMLLLEIFRSC